MLKPLEVIIPNRFRDFDVYPIEERQVELLMESMQADGHWGGLPARKVGDKYEIACGHHRLEAAKRLGIEKISLDVQIRSDAQMISIMIKENMTQRGHENFGAVLDSVRALIVQVVEEIFRLQRTAGTYDSTKVRTHIESGLGVGREVIHKKESSISRNAAELTLRVLKATGHYASLIEKGGAPPEIVAKYNQDPVTSIEAMRMFHKPSQAAGFVEGMVNANGLKVFPIDQHVTMVQQLFENELDLLPGSKIKRLVIRGVLMGGWLETIKVHVTMEEYLAKLEKRVLSLAYQYQTAAEKLNEYAGTIPHRDKLAEAIHGLKQSIELFEKHLG